MAITDKHSLIDPDYSAELPDGIGTIETSVQTAKGRLCVGSAYVGEATHYALFRLDDRGKLDRSFGTDGLTTGTFKFRQSLGYSISELDNGQLMMIGLTSDGSFYYEGVPALARFDASGKLDKTFADNGHLVITNPQASQRNRISAAPPSAPPPSGPPPTHLKAIGTSILVLGNYWGHDSVVFKYNQDGRPDTSFNGTGYKVLKHFSDHWFNARNLHVDDKSILICGTQRTFQDREERSHVVKLGLTGEYDAGFGDNGFAAFPTSLKTLGNFLVHPAAGRILGCGMDTDNAGLLVALKEDGSIDDTFTLVSVPKRLTLRWDVLQAMSAQRKDSALIAAGLWNEGPQAPMLIGRFHANGELDTTFAENGTGAILIDRMTGARNCEIDADGKTLVHGMSTTPNPARGFLIRCLTQVKPSRQLDQACSLNSSANT